MSEDQDSRSKKRSRIFRNVIIGCIAVAALSLAAAFIFLRVVIAPAIEGLGPIFDSPLCDPSNPDGIQDVARIELPPSYSNLSSTCGGLQGWFAYASFDIDPDELHTFVSTTNITTLEQLTTQPEQIYYLHFEELQPLSAFRYGLSDEDEWLEEVIVDTSNPSRWTVYFTLLAG